MTHSFPTRRSSDLALRLDPDISDNYVRRGIVLVDQGRYTLAEIDFEEAIALDENNAWAYNNFGHSAFKQRRYADAIRMFSAALDLDPEIGRASCRERCVSTCSSRWSPYH